MESREGCGLRLHRSLKYLIYDNAPAKLLISGAGGEPNGQNSGGEGPVEFQERNEAQPFIFLRTLAKNNILFSRHPVHGAQSFKATITTFQLRNLPP